MNPSVGVVIVNWNKPRDISRMLDSLMYLKYDNYEVYVVDNDSSDNSVEVIKQHALNVHLLVNEDNLGGTGGFNSGIKFVLRVSPCKYIWLLDNDATVEPRALDALVRVMEADPEIGLSGSRILNADDPEYVVETGAIFDWNSGTVRPVDRNMLKSQTECINSIEVDYVAVCSALVRVSALVDVGLMDERYFLFWDDMDWGITFCDFGYRVVGVPKSEVFHPAFTEYRSMVVDSYYGVRNQLLTFSKFKHHKGAMMGMFHMLRRVAKGGVLMMLTHRSSGILGFCGYWDFLRNKWGKISWRVPSPLNNLCEADISYPVSKIKKVLVIPTKDTKNTTDVIEFLNLEGLSNIDILISVDRKELFSKIDGVNLVLIDYTGGKVFLNTLTIFMRIFLERYDCSIKTSSEKISPFTFAIKRSTYYDMERKALFSTKENVWYLWKVVVAASLGEFVGTIMFVLAWFRGFFLVRR